MEARGGGSIVTLSFLGSDRVFPNYNVMGVAKAALESTVRYLAADLGPQNIRVNAVSAGPMKTLAAAGIGGFSTILGVVRERAPLRRTVETAEVGRRGGVLAGRGRSRHHRRSADGRRRVTTQWGCRTGLGSRVPGPGKTFDGTRRVVWQRGARDQLFPDPSPEPRSRYLSMTTRLGSTPRYVRAAATSATNAAGPHTRHHASAPGSAAASSAIVDAAGAAGPAGAPRRA